MVSSQLFYKEQPSISHLLRFPSWNASAGLKAGAVSLFPGISTASFTVIITRNGFVFGAVSSDELPGEVEEIGLILHLDNEKFPAEEVRLYRYDGSLCLAALDGSPVSPVNCSSVMEPVEAVQAIVLNG